MRLFLDLFLDLYAPPRCSNSTPFLGGGGGGESIGGQAPPGVRVILTLIILKLPLLKDKIIERSANFAKICSRVLATDKLI